MALDPYLCFGCVLCFVCFGLFGQRLCFVFLCFDHAGGVCVLCFRVLAPQAAKSLRGMLTLAVTHSDSGAASDPPCEAPVGAPAPRLQTPKPDLRAAVVSRALAGLVGVHSVGVRECRGGGI